MTLPWRNCYASTAFVNELNALYPKRDRASDGTIGNAEHQSRTSDHNLTVQVGNLWVVRARDVDEDGVPAVALTEWLRKRGAARDPRLYPNGYVIYEKRITKSDFSGWKPYYGANAHDHHFHVSFSTAQAGFDNGGSWGIAAAMGAAPVRVPPPVAHKLKDDPLVNIDIVTGDGDTTFRGTVMAEAGPVSSVVDRAWCNVGMTWAPAGKTASVRVTGLYDNGAMSFQKTYALGNNRRIAPTPEIPPNTVMVTVEGTKPAGAQVSAAIVSKPR